MSAFYEAVGRLVVGYIRQRYRTQLMAVAVLGILGLLAGIILAAKPSSDDE
jgi:hypothetical protein